MATTPERRPGRLRGPGAAAFGALLSAPTPAPSAPQPVAPPGGDDADGAGGRRRHAVLLHGVLSPAEAAAVVVETERRGYERALVNVGGGRQVHLPELRHSARCVVDSPEFADALAARLAAALPPVLLAEGGGDAWDLVGLNERLRFLRYDPGEYFGLHADGPFERGPEAGPLAGQRTFLTVLVYLNDGYDGCATTFYPPDARDVGDHRALPVPPATGSALVHDHRILHAAPRLVAGRKYVLRTDVLYERRRQRRGEGGGGGSSSSGAASDVRALQLCVTPPTRYHCAHTSAPLACDRGATARMRSHPTLTASLAWGCLVRLQSLRNSAHSASRQRQATATQIAGVGDGGAAGSRSPWRELRRRGYLLAGVLADAPAAAAALVAVPAPPLAADDAAAAAAFLPPPPAADAGLLSAVAPAPPLAPAVAVAGVAAAAEDDGVAAAAAAAADAAARPALLRVLVPPPAAAAPASLGDVDPAAALLPPPAAAAEAPSPSRLRLRRVLSAGGGGKAWRWCAARETGEARLSRDVAHPTPSWRVSLRSHPPHTHPCPAWRRRRRAACARPPPPAA
jgi:hypothetical protein